MKLHLPTGLRAALMACLLGMSGTAYADYVWNGTTSTITMDSWNTAANWNVTDGSTAMQNSKGPGCPESNAWNTIRVSNASGSIGTLEGWNIGMELTNTTLTVDNIKKIQNGPTWPAATFVLNDHSTLTANLGTNQQHKMDITLNGGSTMNINLTGNRTDGDTVVNLGQFSAEEHGTINLARKQGQTGAFSSKLTLTGTLTDGEVSAATTLHEITLGTVGTGVTLSQFNYQIAAERFLLSDGPLTATEDNVGHYSVANDNGTLKLYYVTGNLTNYTWDGGTGSWASANWNGGASIAEGLSRVAVTSGTMTIDSSTEAHTQIASVTGGTVNVNGSLQAEVVTISGTGKMKWGENQSSSNLIDVAKISVDGSGAQFWLAHEHADLSAKTDVELKNGGKLYSDDTDFATDTTRKGNLVAFRNLNVTDGGAVEYYWGGAFSFETMTGSGDVSVNATKETSWTLVKALNDYSGTISGTGTNHTLKLGSVDLSSGKTATINTQFGAIGDTVTKTGAGTLILQGNGADAATLSIQGGTVRWGSTGDVKSAEENTALLGFNKVIIGSGAKLEDSHLGGNTAKFDIEMQGGTLYAHAQLQNNGEGVKYGTLTLKAGTANTIDQTWKSCRNFDVLTGGAANGNVEQTQLTIGNAQDGNMKDSFASVTNFNGTLTGTNYNNVGKQLTIGAVSQEAGYTAVINAQVTLGESFTKTGDGSLTLGGTTVLSGNASIDRGSVTAGNLQLKGNTLTLKGSGDAILTHDSVTYTAISAEKDGSITRTGDGSLGLYSDGEATTLSNVKLTTSQDKAYSVKMDNVSLVSEANKTIWLTGTATKTIQDVTTGGTLKIGINDRDVTSASVVTITGTADVNSVQVSDIAGLTVSGTVNAAANSTISALTLSGGTITVKEDHTGTLNVTALTVSGENSTINANLVVAGNGTLDFSSGAVLTMGCDVTINGGELTVVIDQSELASIMHGTELTLIRNIDVLTLNDGLTVHFEGANEQSLDGYGLRLELGADGHSLVVTPEPATATLSLLALAALAARRKRH